MTEMNVDELLTVTQVQQRLKCGRSKLYSILDSGQLRAVKLGHSRRVRVSDLTAYMDSLISPTDHMPIMDDFQILAQQGAIDALNANDGFEEEDFEDESG